MGAKYLKLGRRVACAREDLMACAERRRSSTSDEDGAVSAYVTEGNKREARNTVTTSTCSPRSLYTTR